MSRILPLATLLSIFLILSINSVFGQSDNDCLSYSWAEPAADQLKNALNDGIPTTNNKAIEKILPVVKQITSRYWVNLYYGLDDKKFFMIKNCRSSLMINNNFCNNVDVIQTPMIAYIRNGDEQNDSKKRYVYKINEDKTGKVSLSKLGEESDNYNTTGRFWYKEAGGWTERFPFASGGSGIVYTATFSSNSLSGVIGADRSNAEPCGPCLSNSYVISAANSVANLRLHQYLKIGNDETKIKELLKKMVTEVVSKVDRGYVVNVYFGVDETKDFYMVKDCSTSVNQNAEGCKDTDKRYTAWIRNEAYHGDKERHVYALSEDGTLELGKELYKQAYDPKERAWYEIAEGYSAYPYDFASNDVKGRSYSVPFYGGVASADHVTSEPCNSCESSPTDSYAESTQRKFNVFSLLSRLFLGMIFFH